MWQNKGFLLKLSPVSEGKDHPHRCLSFGCGELKPSLGLALMKVGWGYVACLEGLLLSEQQNRAKATKKSLSVSHSETDVTVNL